ncbi:hypothetical protein D3C72_1191070 [compost metagenome]
MSTRTSKQIAAGQVRTLRSMREKLLGMAKQWEDLDEFNISELETLAYQAEKVAAGFVQDSNGLGAI